MLFTPSLLEMLLDTQDEVTLAKAFQHMRQALYNGKLADLSDFSLVHLCGEVVTWALLDRFVRHFPSVRCINLYSISETHDVAVADLIEFYTSGEKRQFAPVGKVPTAVLNNFKRCLFQLIEGVKVLILDGKTMKRVPIGVPGEVNQFPF